MRNKYNICFFYFTKNKKNQKNNKNNLTNCFDINIMLITKQQSFEKF